MRLAMSSLLLLALASSCRAQSTPAHDEVVRTILRLEASRRESLIKGDVIARNALLADDFVEVAADGSLRTKSQNLNDTTARRIQWTEASVTDEQVRLFDSAALYTAVIKSKGTMDGRPFGSNGTRISRLYVRRDGRWQCVYAQGTKSEDTKP